VFKLGNPRFQFGRCRQNTSLESSYFSQSKWAPLEHERDPEKAQNLPVWDLFWGGWIYQSFMDS